MHNLPLQLFWFCRIYFLNYLQLKRNALFGCTYLYIKTVKEKWKLMLNECSLGAIMFSGIVHKINCWSSHGSALVRWRSEFEPGQGREYYYLSLNLSPVTFQSMHVLIDIQRAIKAIWSHQKKEKKRLIVAVTLNTTSSHWGWV